MCLATVYWAGLDGIVYGASVADSKKYGGFDDDFIYAEFGKPAADRAIPEPSSAPGRGRQRLEGIRRSQGQGRLLTRDGATADAPIENRTIPRNVRASRIWDRRPHAGVRDVAESSRIGPLGDIHLIVDGEHQLVGVDLVGPTAGRAPGRGRRPDRHG